MGIADCGMRISSKTVDERAGELRIAKFELRIGGAGLSRSDMASREILASSGIVGNLLRKDSADLRDVLLEVP